MNLLVLLILSRSVVLARCIIALAKTNLMWFFTYKNTAITVTLDIDFDMTFGLVAFFFYFGSDPISSKSCRFPLRRGFLF